MNECNQIKDNKIRKSSDFLSIDKNKITKRARYNFEKNIILF